MTKRITVNEVKEKLAEDARKKPLTPARALRAKVEAEKAAFKGMTQLEGEAHIEETDKADADKVAETMHGEMEKVGENVHKEAENAKVKLSGKAEKPAKEEKKHEPAFPHETTINAYGFLQLGVDIMQEALGLTKSEKNSTGKAIYPETKVIIESYDAETRSFMIKVA
jgi:hypothetical protein